MRVVILLIVICSLAVANSPATYAAEPTEVYFSQTGHHVSDQYGFLRFWRAHGQVTTFGYPITELLLEDGKPVQYFERARFEYHADHNAVLLGLIGSEYRFSESAQGIRQQGLYFPETGYSIGGEFLDYWQKHSGLRLLGYPISAEEDDNGLVVQWFERGRLEYHPEAMRSLWQEYQNLRGLDLDPLYEIIPTDLGRRIAQQRGHDMSPVIRRQAVPDWSPHLWPQSMYVSLSGYRLEAYEGDVRVLSAPVAIGKPGFETVTGDFRVIQKFWEKDMASTERGESWDTKSVPFTQFFYRDWAIHGTYWHTDFGSRRSHGCVNLPLDAAEWLYNWTQSGKSSTAVTVVP